MKKFLKFVFNDPSNVIGYTVLTGFLLLGAYFSCTDIGGFSDNAPWIYGVGAVLIIWTIANIIDYSKHSHE